MVRLALGLFSLFVCGFPAASAVSASKPRLTGPAPLVFNPLQAILFKSAQTDCGGVSSKNSRLFGRAVSCDPCPGGACCPIGDICATTASGCCTPGVDCSGYSCQEGSSLCPGESFCCPTGETCFRDSDGTPDCRAGGAPTQSPTPKPTPTPTPTPQPQPQPQPTPQPQPQPQPQPTPQPQPQPQPTPTPQPTPQPQPTPAPQPTVVPQVTTSANSLVLPFTSASAGQVPVATYTVSPAPAVPDAGAANATVGATDPRIQYSSQWKDSSTCGGSSKSASDAGSQFVFQFKGSAIFMNINLGLTGLVYSADVDGVTDIVDGFRTTQNCGTGWSRFNLDSSLHTVTITILGPSQNAPASSTSQSSLDFSSFTVTSEGSGSAANAGTDTLRSSRRSWAVSLGLSFITAGIMKLAFI